jgi:hypothetical protein
MNVDICFVLLYHVEISKNNASSYNAIDIFENLTMNRGALTWVENF